MNHPFDDPDMPATPEELAEAEALAQVLDGAQMGTSPELETAALLRQARGAKVPDVLDRVLPALPARRRRRWWRLPVVLVPAVAGLLLIGVGVSSHRAVESVPVSAFRRRPSAPLPSATLLAVQARAANGDRASLAALEAEMRSYRARMYREGKRQ